MCPKCAENDMQMKYGSSKNKTPYFKLSYFFVGPCSGGTTLCEITFMYVIIRRSSDSLLLKHPCIPGLHEPSRIQSDWPQQERLHHFRPLPFSILSLTEAQQVHCTSHPPSGTSALPPHQTPPKIPISPLIISTPLRYRMHVISRQDKKKVVEGGPTNCSEQVNANTCATSRQQITISLA